MKTQYKKKKRRNMDKPDRKLQPADASPVIRIGLDIHGVSDADTVFFSRLSRILVDGGQEVHIITGAERTPELERYLREELNLRWTHFFSITGHHREIGTEIAMIQGRPYLDDDLWNRAKADYCRRCGIQLHIDDSPLYGRYFTTPYARYLLPPPEKKRSVAIMGGSFNPVTTAHTRLAETILRERPDIREVWLMPAFRHPFRKHCQYDTGRVRMLRMVETARIRCFGYEIDHRLSGETWHTLHRLIHDADYGRYYDFHVVIGSDCALDFDRKWRHAAELANLAPFIVVERPGAPLTQYSGLLSRPPHTLIRSDMPDISATEVRRRLREGRSVRGMLAPAVENYIMAHRLYQDPEAGDSRCDAEAAPASHPDLQRGVSPVFHPEDAAPGFPAIRVDLVVCTLFRGRLTVLLVRTSSSAADAAGTEAGSGKWRLPGAPPRPSGESLPQTALRLLESITGRRDLYLEQLKTYGDPCRRTGRQVISTAYFALAPPEFLAALLPAGENAGGPDISARLHDHIWWPLTPGPGDAEKTEETPAGAPALPPEFDHGVILKDLLQRLHGKIFYTPIAFSFLPECFTWRELRGVYEIILGKELDAANFKRKIRSMYHIRQVMDRCPVSSPGRPPSLIRCDGMKEMYI